MSSLPPIHNPHKALAQASKAKREEITKIEKNPKLPEYVLEIIKVYKEVARVANENAINANRALYRSIIRISQLHTEVENLRRRLKMMQGIFKTKPHS